MDPTIIIEIRGCHSYAISLGPDPAFFCNIDELEGAAAIGVAIESLR